MNTQMGMGKTIQAISLILAHRSDGQTLEELLGSNGGSGGGNGSGAGASPGGAGGAAGARRAASSPPPDAPRPRIALRGAPDAAAEPAAAQAAVAAPSGRRSASATPAPAPMDCDAPAAAAAAPAGPAAAGGGTASASSGGVEITGEVLSPAAQRRARIEAAIGVDDGADGCAGAAAEAGPARRHCKATLVVCPVVAVIQWRGEIARYTEPGALKVRRGVVWRPFLHVLDGGKEQGARFAAQKPNHVDLNQTTTPPAPSAISPIYVYKTKPSKGRRLPRRAPRRAHARRFGGRRRRADDLLRLGGRLPPHDDARQGRVHVSRQRQRLVVFDEGAREARGGPRF